MRPALRTNPETWPFAGSRVNRTVPICPVKTSRTAGRNVSALRLRGHLNYTVHHEVFLRAESLTISGSNARIFGLKEFQEFGEAFWKAFSRRQPTKNNDFSGGLPPITPAAGGGLG